MKAAYSILWVEPGGVMLLGVSSRKIMWGLDREIFSFSWTSFSLYVICWSVFLRCLYQPITFSCRKSIMQFGRCWNAKTPHAMSTLALPAYCLPGFSLEHPHSRHRHRCRSYKNKNYHKTNNCKHLGSHMDGIIYSMQYSLIQFVAGDVLLYICLRKKMMIFEVDMIYFLYSYNSLYISSMWMWSAWESFMVTCSSILLSPRMKPSFRKIVTETNCNCNEDDIHNKRSVVQRWRSIYRVLMSFDYSTNCMFITLWKLYYIDILLERIHFLVLTYAKYSKRSTWVLKLIWLYFTVHNTFNWVLNFVDWESWK